MKARLVGLSLLFVSASAHAGPHTPAPPSHKPVAPRKAGGPAPTAEPAPTASALGAPAAAQGGPSPIMLNLKTGSIEIGKGLATLNVPKEFGYLDTKDAEKVLVSLWGNPPDPEILGMLVPSDIPVEAKESWGVVISYQNDGHVSDEDAEKIDYTELLSDMKKSIKDENEERKKQGFEAIELVGWAAPPHYDKSTRKIYWAKDLQFGTQATHTLNYSIRALGKEGVLVLNAVAAIEQLTQVEQGMKQVLSFVEFKDGNRYDQFDPKTGKMAAYGVAALVAGGVAAKVGLFKGLIVAILAAKKILGAGLVAAGAGVSKFFKRKRPETPGPPPATPA